MPLTAAGKIFLDHARLALAQVEAASTAHGVGDSRENLSLSLGFLAGQEVVWLPHSLRILREEGPETKSHCAASLLPSSLSG